MDGRQHVAVGPEQPAWLDEIPALVTELQQRFPARAVGIHGGPDNVEARWLAATVDAELSDLFRQLCRRLPPEWQDVFAEAGLAGPIATAWYDLGWFGVVEAVIDPARHEEPNIQAAMLARMGMTLRVRPEEIRLGGERLMVLHIDPAVAVPAFSNKLADRCTTGALELLDRWVEANDL